MSTYEKICEVFNKPIEFLYSKVYLRIFWLCRFLTHPNKWIKHKSYYPERVSKSTIKIFWEQLGQWFKYGYPNEFYFSYGFDVKSDEEIKSYLHYNPFSKLRDKYNTTVSPVNSSIPILRNKIYFEMFCSYLGVCCASTTGLWYGNKDGKIYLPQLKKSVTLNEFCHNNSGIFFLKPFEGECGEGIIVLEIKNGKIYLGEQELQIDDLKKRCRGTTYLIQRKVIQHPIMASLHPQSLNTIRLVTVKNIHTDKISIFPSILRIGTGESLVDNTSQGGIAVGIDFEKKRLKEFGFLKPQYGGRVDFHPDTHIKFKEFSIPYLDEAIMQAKILHSHLTDLHSIGWDIAIGPDGPIFIEGNDNWEINGPQICNDGLKEKFLSFLTEKSVFK